MGRESLFLLPGGVRELPPSSTLEVVESFILSFQPVPRSVGSGRVERVVVSRLALAGRAVTLFEFDAGTGPLSLWHRAPEPKSRSGGGRTVAGSRETKQQRGPRQRPQTKQTMQTTRPETAAVHAKAKALAQHRKHRKQAKSKQNLGKENNRSRTGGNTLVVQGTNRPVRLFNGNGNGAKKYKGKPELTEEEERVAAAAAKGRVEKERDLRAAQERLALFQWYNKLTRNVIRAWAVEARRSAAVRKLEAAKASKADAVWAARAKARILRRWKVGAGAAGKRRRYAEALSGLVGVKEQEKNGERESN